MKRSLVLFFILFSLGARAEDAPVEASFDELTARPVHVEAEIQTVAPLWVGVRGGVRFFGKLGLFGGWGVQTDSYLQNLGQISQTMHGDSDLSDTIQNSLSSNRTWIAGADYDLGDRDGWVLGFLFQHFESHGTTSLAKVGRLTGVDVTNLQAAQGSGPEGLDSQVSLLWLYAQYRWPLSDRLAVNGVIGAAKMVSAQERLRDSNTPWEQLSPNAQGTQIQAQNALEDVLLRKTFTPLAGVSIEYNF